MMTFLAACGGGAKPPRLTAADVVVNVLEDSPTIVDPKVTVLPIHAGTPKITITQQPAHGEITQSGSQWSYKPEADYNGADIVTYTATLGEATVTGNFLITVEPVNDAPVMTPGSDVSVDEDAGLQSFDWATGVSAGPNERSQKLTFNVTTGDPTLFSTTPAIDANGRLTFTPAANRHGNTTITIGLKDDGGTENGGVSTAPTETFTITIRPVNDAPSFTKGADQAQAEDPGLVIVTGWATGISAGPNESAQAVTFAVTYTNAAIFAAPPAVDANGTLSYQPTANAFGSSNITVTAWDNGGTELGGSNHSVSQSFTIAVLSANDAPSFAKGANISVDEDSAAYTQADWATAMSPGPANESAQTVTFSVTSTDPALFSTGPAVDPTGKLTFALVENAYGTATVTVTAWDNGGTANGGVNSFSDSFAITVNAVNDVPRFTKGFSVVVGEDSGAYSHFWATDVAAGPANEMAAQNVTFSVTADNAALFSAQPAIASDGTLTFTPSSNANGSANVTARAWDSGGTVLGGVNASTDQYFSITVRPINDAPGFTPGGDLSLAEDSGAYSGGWASAINAGPPNENWQTVTFSVSNTNPALFSVQPTMSANGTLTFTPALNAVGVAVVSATASDNGGNSLGGQNTSGPAIFTITLNPRNHAPTFTKGSDQYVFDSAGTVHVPGWATNITAGSGDGSQILDFQLTMSLADAVLFSTPPSLNVSTGDLDFAPTTGATGTALVTVTLSDNGGAANGGSDTSSQTFLISINGQNTAPSFTKGADQTIDEDAHSQTVPLWASAISAGPGEDTQQIDFQVTVTSDPGLFTTAPYIDPDGTLHYTPSADANGTAIIDVVLHDNGGIANSGTDTSVAQSFTITVNAVNDAPTFTGSGDVNSYEDVGAFSLAWVSASSAGPGDEAGQSINYKVTTVPTSLFSVQPTIASDGTLSFTPATDANGQAIVTVYAQDNGGTANGGKDKSASLTFNIFIAAVNDPPTFDVPASLTFTEDQVYALLVTNISLGPNDEVSFMGFNSEWFDFPSYMFVITSDTGLLGDNTYTGWKGFFTMSWWGKPNTFGSGNLYLEMWDEYDLSVTKKVVPFIINPVNDSPITNDDVAQTTTNLPVDIWALNNDYDIELDTLTIVGVEMPQHGTASETGGIVHYTPDLGFIGTDTFKYFVYDGTVSAPATIHVQIDPDATPPHFLPTQSNPVNGALLNIDQAYGAGVSGVPQMKPARFVFDDPFLDAASMTVLVSINGVPLVPNTQYFVKNSQAGTMLVSLSSSLPLHQAGDLVEFNLTNVKDLSGNAGSDVNVTVFFDGVRPEIINWDYGFSPSQRLILVSNEALDTSPLPTMKDLTSGDSIIVEPDQGVYKGSGYFSLGITNNAYFFVPRDLLPMGHEILMDRSSFRDLAGNLVFDDVVHSKFVVIDPATGTCCYGTTDSIHMVSIVFTDHNSGAILQTVAPQDITGDAFLLQNVPGVIETDIQVVFDKQVYSNSRLEFETKLGFSSRQGIANHNTTKLSDTVVFSQIPFVPRKLFHLRLSVNLQSSPPMLYYEHEFHFAVAGDASDITPSVVTAFNALRGNGALPIIRPEEALTVGFSETLDPRGLIPANFTIIGATAIFGTIVKRIESVNGMQVRAADVNGNPIALPMGDYSLVLDNLTDLATPANAMGHTILPFTVAPLPGRQVELLATSFVNDTDPYYGFLLAFGDKMSPASFSDTGPILGRGSRLEERWGTQWIPLKGVVIEADPFDNVEIVKMRGYGTFKTLDYIPNRSYRFSLLDGLTNIDGAPLAALPMPIEFTTGNWPNLGPTISYLSAGLSDIPANAFTFGGSPISDTASLYVWYMGSGALQVKTSTFTVTSDTMIDPNLSLMFPAGQQTPFTVRVTDSTGHDTTLPLTAYRLSSATQLDATPMVFAGANQNEWIVSGQVSNTQDAMAISYIGVNILIVDTSIEPINVIGTAAKGIAQLIWNTDGSLNYSATFATEAGLSPLSPPFAYMADAQMKVPFIIGGENTSFEMLTYPSAPFGTAP